MPIRSSCVPDCRVMHSVLAATLANLVLGHGMLEHADEVKLSPQVRAETFREFLTYLYMGYVNTADMGAQVKAQLARIAQLYGVPSLRTLASADDCAYVSTAHFLAALSEFRSPTAQDTVDTDPSYSFISCFSSPSFSDFTFLLGDRPYYAHKV